MEPPLFVAIGFQEWPKRAQESPNRAPRDPQEGPKEAPTQPPTGPKMNTFGTNSGPLTVSKQAGRQAGKQASRQASKQAPILDGLVGMREARRIFWGGMGAMGPRAIDDSGWRGGHGPKRPLVAARALFFEFRYKHETCE